MFYLLFDTGIYQINTLLILLFQQLFATHLVGRCIFSYNPLANWFQSPNRRLSSLLNPQREGYKLQRNMVSSRLGITVSIPKGEATNEGALKPDVCSYLMFQSPKGRLQTYYISSTARQNDRRFNPQMEGYKPFMMMSYNVSLSSFNPQMEGYKPQRYTLYRSCLHRFNPQMEGYKLEGTRDRNFGTT